MRVPTSESAIVEEVVRSGEAPCSIREGVIAIEQCLRLQDYRGARCAELGCPLRHYRRTFELELARARSGVGKRKTPKGEATPPKKNPRKRAWQM